MMVPSTSGAPEVDGTIIVNDIVDTADEHLAAGVLGEVEISDVAGYDLVGQFRTV